MSTLGQIIEFLETQDPKAKVPHGFGKPMSYRGYYDQVAFEPVDNTTVGKMLAHAKSAIGPTFTGYKGGDYIYDRFTSVWIADYGRLGDPLSELLLKYMIAEGKLPAKYRKKVATRG